MLIKRRPLIAGAASIAAYQRLPANAQLAMTGAGAAARGASYVGPGDIASGAEAAYSLRAYNAAYATGSNKAINVRRATDNATLDILILANGSLDVATAAAFLSGTTGYLTTWYDQSGNGFHATQATAGAQPQLVLNYSGALPAILFSGAQILEYHFITNIVQPFTYSWVAARTGAIGSYGDVLASVSFIQTGFNNGPNAVFMYATSAAPSVAATDGVLHSVQNVFNGASSVLNVDGSATTESPGTSQTSNVIDIGGNESGNFLTGVVLEGIVWPFSAASIRANQKAYYGTP